MAYQTGSVNSPAVLKTIIENFCVANGWTVTTVASVTRLNNANSHIQIGTTSTGVYLQGALDSSTTTLNSPSGLNAPIASWPVTYHLFAFGNPCQVVCAINYDILIMNYLMFGDIVKVNDSAYVGGDWYWGTRGDLSGLVNNHMIYGFDADSIDSNYDGAVSGSVMPFMQTFWTTTLKMGSYIHAEIDNSIWKTASYSTLTTNHVKLSPTTLCSIFRGLNTWNSQAVLVPIHLDALGGSSLWHYLGYVEHIRLIRIDNYNIGDIVTIGSDRWKVFPCFYKDTAYRNSQSIGVTTVGHVNYYTTVKSSGTLGFAIRYDGP